MKWDSDDRIDKNSVNNSECHPIENEKKERNSAFEDGSPEGLNKVDCSSKPAMSIPSKRADFNPSIPRDHLGESGKRKLKEHDFQEESETSFEEQDDYMSAAFLDSIDGNDEVKSYKRKRIKQLNDSMLKGQGKSKEILRIEEWDQSQNKKLTAENKGFQMLLKMGYKEGQSIGKATEGNALIDPIAVTLKNDKLGLGNSTKASKSYLSITQKKAIEESLEKKKLRFRDAMIDKRYGQLVEKDVEKARHICMDLDEKNNKPQSPLWPRTNPIPTLHLPPGINTASELYKSTLDDTESDQEDFDSLRM